MTQERVLLEALKPWLANGRCRTCDCLQAALAHLELDGDEELRAFIAPHRVPPDQMHGCVGCDPCPPAATWSLLLREFEDGDDDG